MRHVPCANEQGQPESNTPQNGDGESFHGFALGTNLISVSSVKTTGGAGSMLENKPD